MQARLWILLFVMTLQYALIAQSNSSHEDTQRWQDFKAKFNKRYDSKNEEEKRFQIFLENVKLIEKYKVEAIARGSKGMSGITKFADMTQKEFRSKMLMPAIDPKSQPCTVGEIKTQIAEDLSTNNIPSSWDWSQKGAVTDVKDQGTVGSCWAFSTTGNIEGQWFLAGNKLVSLSEEQLVDCDGYDCGVFGGWPCRAYQYVMEAGGIMSEVGYPYCVGTGDCYPCAAPGYNETFCGPPPEYCNGTEWPCKANSKSQYAAHISEWKQFSTNETQLAAQLVQNGPLSVLIDVNGIPPLQYHEYGVWDPYDCDPTELDHAVLLVGYGVEDDTPYWLIKNSWGKDWSNLNGYFMMMRGSGTCGVNLAVTSATI